VNDRRLIELAAEACALPECGWMADTFTYVKDNTFTTWDPLNDDGDALRLAVRLGIGLLPEATDVRKGTAICHERFGWHIFTGLPDEPQAAARHAIVRAAAAIAQQRGSGEGG
jgi:hypothetical protein